MPCFKPLHGYKSRHRSETTGEHGFTFNRKDALPNGKLKPTEMAVPCGQCLGCRIDRSREWAIRLVHEATQHEDAMFLTLTYAPEHLPRSGSLQPSHFTNFMKRYRKHVAPTKIRYFHCGEYGERLSRPHYHAIVFGHAFTSLYLVAESEGRRLYGSRTLDELWGKGFCTIGDVTWQSAAYVARYVLKKITGDPAGEHYQRVDPSSGEIHYLQPEYVTMSRRPGIGKKWFEQYHSDVYPDDFVVHRGKKQKTPRYYDRLLRELDADAHTLIKEKRIQAAELHAENNTPDRLAVREQVMRAKTKLLKRKLHDDH